jgi:hypothetical protein
MAGGKVDAARVLETRYSMLPTDRPGGTAS